MLRPDPSLETEVEFAGDEKLIHIRVMGILLHLM